MPFHLESLWGVTLMPHRGCAMVGTQNKIVRVGKNSGPVLTCLWTKVHEISEQRTRPFVLSRYWQLSLEVVENRINVKVFPQLFLRETTPTFLPQIVSPTYLPQFGEVWLSSVCWSPSGKPGNEVEGRNYGGRPIWSRLWTKVDQAVCWTKVLHHLLLRWCRRPIVVCNALVRLCRPISCFIPKI